jgi:endonuclease/exonuclease/phosphatase family metal-dependent hydrolase
MTLRLLTWNIWMMPPISFQSPKNTARAAAIAEELANQDADVVCLIKSFDSSARDVIAKRLAQLYPHRYGPLNDHGSPFKINGGVWVLSKIPLSDYRELQFSASSGIESFSRKGALSLYGNSNGQRFRLIATHLQGESGPNYSDDAQRIRNQQVDQIARELLGPSESKVPWFMCGDFVTPRRDPHDPFAEGAGYKHILSALGVQNGLEARVTLDDSRVHNDLAIDDTGRVAELDYILLRDNLAAVRGSWQQRIFRRQGWDGPQGRRDLAYRYAVSAEFDFG